MSKRGPASRVKWGPARYWGAAAVGAVLVLGAALAWRAAAPRVASSDTALSSAAVAPAAVRRETRPTLDPARFVGKVALAHQVAREIPDILDQLDCYCGCEAHAGHKSLLSCYTDGHAVT